MLRIVDQFGQMRVRFYHNFVSYQWLNNFFLLSELGPAPSLQETFMI